MEPGIFQYGAILTLIGMGTAFAVLMLLMAVMALVARLVARPFTLRRPSFGRGKAAPQEAADGSAETHDKALAAVVAVTALLANTDDSRQLVVREGKPSQGVPS